MAILRSFTLFLEEKSSENWKEKSGQDILFLWGEQYNWYFGYDPAYEEYLIIKEREEKITRATSSGKKKGWDPVNNGRIIYLECHLIIEVWMFKHKRLNIDAKGQVVNGRFLFAAFVFSEIGRTVTSWEWEKFEAKGHSIK